MRIAMIGAGALGMLIGAKMQLAGHETTWYVRRQAQLELLKNQGFQLDERTVFPMRIEKTMGLMEFHQEKMDSIANQLPDVLIWTIKQTHLNDDILMWASERFGQAPHWIAFQNGIGHERVYARWKSPDKMGYAVTTEAAFKGNDQSVSHTGKGHTWFGTYGFEIIPTWLEEWVQRWNQAGLRASAVAPIEPILMRKWIVNCVINPLTAIYRVRNGQLLEQADLQEKAKGIFDEVIRVLGESYTQEKLQLSPLELWQWILVVCAQTAENHSSMLQDILLEKPIEWTALNGEVLRLANAKKMELPIHNWLQQQLMQRRNFK